MNVPKTKEKQEREEGNKEINVTSINEKRINARIDVGITARPCRIATIVQHVINL